MFTKIYSGFKNFLKENKYHIIISIFILLVINIKIPYHIEGKGSLVNLNNKIKIVDENSISGSYNITYVSVYDGTVGTYIISLFNKNMDLVKIENVKEDKKDKELDKVLLDNSLSDASIIAFKSANKELSINKNNIIIAYIKDFAKTNLNIGDKLEYIDGIKINSIDDIDKVISKHNYDEKLLVNDDKFIYINNINNKKTLGISLTSNYEFDNIDFKFKENERGPSGGLMISLLIYDKITNEDLSRGRVIAGTGTIDKDGNVGEIGGIKYKIMGALKSDIFFLPIENYEEAKEFVKERKYNINLVPVKTLDEAINYLKK